MSDNILSKIPSADDGEPALWEHNDKIGRVPLRFRSETLAKAAADKLNAEPRKK